MKANEFRICPWWGAAKQFPQIGYKGFWESWMLHVQVGVLNSSAAFARKMSRVHLVKIKGKSSYAVTTVMAVTSAPKQQEAAKSTTVDVGGESARVGVLGASGYTGSEVCSFSPLFLIDEAEVWALTIYPFPSPPVSSTKFLKAQVDLGNLCNQLWVHIQHWRSSLSKLVIPSVRTLNVELKKFPVLSI